VYVFYAPGQPISVYAKDASTTNSTNFARLNPDRPSTDDRASCTPNHTIIVVNNATNMRIEESRCCNEAR
jgi:hypothetical protein